MAGKLRNQGYNSRFETMQNLLTPELILERDLNDRSYRECQELYEIQKSMIEQRMEQGGSGQTDAFRGLG